MTWTRWRRWSVPLRWTAWHILLAEDRAVCGTRVDSPMEERQTREDPTTRRCKKCERLHMDRVSWELS